jgi:hypothetical protein
VVVVPQGWALVGLAAGAELVVVSKDAAGEVVAVVDALVDEDAL